MQTGEITELRRVREKLETTAQRLRAVEAERDSWRRKYRAAVRQHERDKKTLEILLHSKSYRLGRTIVLMVKSPLRTSWRLIRALFRLVVPRRPAPAAGTTGAGTAGAGTAGAPAKRGKREADPRPVLSDRLPVYAYVAWDMDLDDLRSLARAAGQAAAASGNHVALIVTDVPQFSMLRDTGLAIEYIPDHDTWTSHRPDIDWDEFRGERLGQLLRVHRPARTLFVDRADVLTVPRLLALHAEPVR